ncbi:hypothetical protein V2J09_016989 [Rumex salicifolius]
MDSSSTSQRLTALAQQLRLYKPPSIISDLEVDEESKAIEDRSNKVISQVVFSESSSPLVQTLKLAEKNNGGSFKPKKAAVLVCLYEGDNGDLRVILTKRSSRLSTHSGEVALPGGKMDEGDKDEADTATREAHEEIGLDPSLVNVVTFLEPFLSKHILRVVPVIGILSKKEAFKPLPNVAEVDSIFDAPLEMFIKDENRRVEEREWMGCKYLINYFDYETDDKKYVIWGLTAAILIRAASVVYQRSPPFLSQNPAMNIARKVGKDAILP